MKLYSLLLLLASAQIAIAQIKTIPFDKKELPKNIHYAGHIINAVEFTDNDGEHLLITTETGNIEDKGDETNGFLKADVFAYCYLINGNQQTLSWQMHDFTIVCPVDTRAMYVPGTYSITDLNKDGRAEVWLMYITACRGDVSPASMKIIMHEGVKKYALRGSDKVKISNKVYAGGEYTLDAAFSAGPAVFRQYALHLWKTNLLEVWD
jgi:hypothetical protein